MDKPKQGGKRTGAGRKKGSIIGDQKTKAYTVSLMPKERDAIVKEHGSLTKAIKTLLRL